MAIDISKERQDKTIIYIASVRLRKKHPSFSRFERRRFTEKVRATEWASKREREFLNEFENILLGNPIPEPVEDVTLEEYINRLIKYVLDFRLFMKRKFDQFLKKQKSNIGELFSQVPFYCQFMSKSLYLCGFRLIRR